MNSRLDTIQAAILIEKLKIFPEEIELREAVAQRYKCGSRKIEPYSRAACDCRRWVDLGAIHDPGARPRQAAGRPERKGHSDGGLLSDPAFGAEGLRALSERRQSRTGEKICKTVVALPMHPYLDATTQDGSSRRFWRASTDGERACGMSLVGQNNSSGHGEKCLATKEHTNPSPQARLALIL